MSSRYDNRKRHRHPPDCIIFMIYRVISLPREVSFIVIKCVFWWTRLTSMGIFVLLSHNLLVVVVMTRIARWNVLWFLVMYLYSQRYVNSSASIDGNGNGDGDIPPNIIFLVVESTDGRTWQRGYQDDVIPLPNLRKLEDQGATSFYRHYCNTPVCCPSRASFWSGKYPHKIPHAQQYTSYPVHGVWNNFEGLPKNYTESIMDILQRNGYITHMSGKQDYVTGGHSLNVRLNAWTMYVDFPYNWTQYEPWIEEDAICPSNGTVTATNPDTPQESTSHKDDWRVLNETLDWIRDYRDKNDNQKGRRPFFVYQGMNIVHPPYHTNEYWLHQINKSKIQVPDWPKTISSERMHPCDIHMSMLKGCLPISTSQGMVLQSKYRRRHIRQIYYAMIAEFDAMVGRYMDTIEELGWTSQTIFIVTSDHGDMQMEHAQFYKMSPYDASSSVPLILWDPRRALDTNRIIKNQPTQHIDLFPTILELAGLSSWNHPQTSMLDGYSLVPFMEPSWQNSISSIPSTDTKRRLGEMSVSVDDQNDDNNISNNTKNKNRKNTTTIHDRRPPYVVVQYHGDDSPMSWFAIIQALPCMTSSSPSGNKKDEGCMYKLVVWGTGQQVESQLFDLSNDPNETTNLIHDADYQLIVGMLNSNLQNVVDYPIVAQDVAKYNRDSFELWMDQNPTSWKELLNSTSLRWHSSWRRKSELALAAIEEWLTKDNPATIQGCRRESAWPPPN